MDSRLILVLTNSVNDWIKVQNAYRDKGDNIVHINCDNGSLYNNPVTGAERAMAIANVQGMGKGQITSLLLGIISQYSGYDIVIGLHGLTINDVDRTQLPPRIPIDDTKCTTAISCPYRHLLEALFSKQGVNQKAIQKKFDDLFDDLKNVKKKLINIITVLKHHIALLFLPLDIDFQALQELTDKSKQNEYAKGIIEEYRNRQNGEHPFLQLLADLQFLVTKTKGLKLNNGTTISASLPEEDLPEGKCLKELTEEAGLQDDQLKELCKSWGFKKDAWEIDLNTPIVEFFQVLDDIISKDSPNGFLEAINKRIDDKDFNQWFVQWFAQLEKLIDRLEEKIGV